MSAVSPARRAAYEVVRRVFEQEAYADRAFATAAESSPPSLVKSVSTVILGL